MITISHELIALLHITPQQTLDWAMESFLLKDSGNVFLPHKTSISFNDNQFMNTMPCIVPQLNAMGVKIVTRYPNRPRTIDGDLLLYDYYSGDLLALIDAFWLTNARTGAVAALAVQALAKPDFENISLLGLGNTARATMSCLLALYPEKRLHVRLLSYKEQASQFKQEFTNYANVHFESVTGMENLVSNSDVLISCITNACGLLADDAWFKPGITVIPVHTKGFQNCDLFFDQVFADDRDHVKSFKYFDSFRRFGEIAPVLARRKPGRASSKERILSYNIGLGLHDVVFARHIYDQLLDQMIENKECSQFQFYNSSPTPGECNNLSVN